MAGHSKFKNIMHRKGVQDAKRAKVFTKLLKEITVAVKMGGGEPENNPRLRSAISEARSNNTPKDNIERAIARGQCNMEGQNFEEIRYEGYAVGGISVIVEALTDNRNRTASEVRSTFTKNGGNLGENGSVSFGFERVGVIAYKSLEISFDELFEKALDANADDVKNEGGELLVITKIENLHDSFDKLSKTMNAVPLYYNVQWLVKNGTEIQLTDLEQAKKVIKLIDALEDIDDVQKVFSNFDAQQSIMEQL